MRKVFVLGIAGATQSGKSTFAKELEATLENIKVKLFHIDNYHKPKALQPIAEAPFTKKEYLDFNSLASFDLPQLYADLLNEISTAAVDLIIVEGTLILQDEKILDLLDLKLFVDTRADERAVRYIERYAEVHGHEFIRNSYLDLVRYRMDELVVPTKWRADMILNGSAKSEVATQAIKAYIQTKLQGI